jgi:hypothetical protein
MGRLGAFEESHGLMVLLLLELAVLAILGRKGFGRSEGE